LLSGLKAELAVATGSNARPARRVRTSRAAAAQPGLASLFASPKAERRVRRRR
jgi:hypothetical protein